jgi:hypothetical protein
VGQVGNARSQIGSELHSLKLTNTNKSTLTDFSYLALLLAYLAVLFVFSSFFYLATEDYEAATAVEMIRGNALIGRSTGWPYTPLAAYMFYLYSLGFGDSILGFRLLTGLLMLVATIPLYLTLRIISEPSMAFALTLLSYSLSTFPHPRLEYFVEGAIAACAIYFGAKFLQTERRVYIYCCAIFAFLAFASRGHPNSSALLVLLPISLASVPWVIAGRDSWNAAIDRVANKGRLWLTQIRSNLYSFIVVAILTIASFVWISRFLREILYKRLFVEYADLNDLSSTWIKSNSSFWSSLLLMILVTIYLVIRFRGKLKASMALVLRRSLSVFGSFIVVGGLIVVVALWVGYTVNDLLFFVFPTDIIADHQAVGRIGSRARGVLPVFLIVMAATLYFYLNGRLRADKAAVSLFLLLLVPATFARFFPTYNMLYLGVFPLAVFLGCVLPCLLSDNQTFYSQFKKTMIVFFIIYSLASNYLLFIRTQLADLNNDRLIKLETGPLSGIFVERDVFKLFEDVRARLDLLRGANHETYAFLSSRYVKFIPLVYGWRDSLAGQNLMIQLGKLWSYDDLIKIKGVESDNVFDWEGLIYRWREAAVVRLEESQVRLIVMSLYDETVLEEDLEPSLDPLREYLRQNFTITDVIEPTMTLYRRSSFPEGAVILTRNAEDSATPVDQTR